MHSNSIRFYNRLIIKRIPFGHILAWNLSDESDRLYYQNRLYDLSSITSSKSFADMQGTLGEFTARTTKIVPIALALIRTQTSNVSDKLKFLFDFNWNWLPYSSNYATHNYITNNIKASLSPEEYNKMLIHINAYIESVVTDKLQKYEENKKHEQIAPELALYIANIVKEKIVQHKYVLNDEDVERIAEIVRQKLARESVDKSGKAGSFVLSQENLETISRLIKQNIEVHRHEWRVENGPQVNLDIEEILYKILTSPKLQDLVDQRIGAAVSPLSGRIGDQQISIDALSGEIDQIKAELRNIIGASEQSQASLVNLKIGQDELSSRLELLQNQQNEQLERLLSQIDLKLSSLSDKHFAAIDKHIRAVLVDIIGFKTTDGKPIENIDITNWIRNVFVAKELLDTRLNELNDKFNKKLNVELNQSATILIKDISEKIKQDVIVLLEKNKAELLNVGGKTNLLLDEQRIKDIVREALAVYDADKTGMVDYALESSGGQVLSTR